MRTALPALLLGGLVACSPVSDPTPPAKDLKAGFAPDISLADPGGAEAGDLQAWIDQSVTLLTSDAFARDLSSAARSHPRVWISRERDMMPTAELHAALSGRDVYAPGLWWPPTQVVLDDGLPDRASTGPAAGGMRGDIRLGRLHLERYRSENPLRRSCAINTMVHEISHSLSNRADVFHMHILDTRADAPPHGVYQASYLIGAVAQCSWLRQQGVPGMADLELCLARFSDPTTGSRFNARACDAPPAAPGSAVLQPGR